MRAEGAKGFSGQRRHSVGEDAMEWSPYSGSRRYGVLRINLDHEVWLGGREGLPYGVEGAWHSKYLVHGFCGSEHGMPTHGRDASVLKLYCMALHACEFMEAYE